MSNIAETMVALANLPKVLEAAQFLASVGVIREEDVNKCVRVYVSKHPEINEHFQRRARELGSVRNADV